MILRLTAALLAATTTSALATADVTTAGNPKPRSTPYRQVAHKPTLEERTAQSKAEYEAQLLQQKLAAIAQQPAAQTQGGFQQGNPRGVLTTLALNGSDSCATPDPLSGTGTYPFDNSLATTGTQGQTEAACLAYGLTGINNDVWFVWTAPSSGTATMSLCNGTGMDSKIAAYAGSACPAAGTALACNDDSCGFQSAISFTVTSGSNYMLQLGNYPGASGNIGTFTLAITTGGPSNDDCSAAIAISRGSPV